MKPDFQLRHIGELPCKIQVNTDDNIEGRDELARQIEAAVNATLSRFSDQITRVEVHLSDENAGKSRSCFHVVGERRLLVQTYFSVVRS